MATTRKALIVFYALVAIVALFATWSQNLQYYMGDGPAVGGSYMGDLKATPASRSFTVDIGLYLLAGAALMLVEGRRVGVRFVWLYIIFGFLVAISVTFPLFLIARELRLAKAETTSSAIRLAVTDIIVLALTTLAVGALTYILFT